ncbi:hypothetical protein CEE45_04355 [Candidatus Heimdallarchaeota archaeon B3_Heim]|nr:MAG: hypothetical protein CEE45_04355 [Candidatus Heimdallarchaeota archaeon B3_Heim]
MSSEENMKWKQREEHSEEQTEDRRETLNEIEEKLLAEEPYNDQIVINNENTGDSQILAAIENYPDQLVVEEDKIEEISFNNLKEQNQKQLCEQKEKEAEDGLEIKENETERELNRETGQKGEEDSKEEEEENTLMRKLVLTHEDYNDQTIIRETDTGDQSTTHKEEKVKISLDERLEQKTEQVKEIQDINTLIKELNTQLQAGRELDTKTYTYLNTLNTDGSYPNIAFVYKGDGNKSVEILDRRLYDKLIDNQKLGNFRLEWQRLWFEGINQMKPTEQGRKLFLLDLSKEQELPASMRRIYLARNTYTWNTLAPTKRELHSKNIREFIDTLFGKRASFSDFENVKDFTYQKKMNNVWREFQRVFKKDIALKTTKRPALFALKHEYTRENIEHALTGIFWKYYHGLDRIGRRNMKQWGYNNLLQFMKKKATGVYPTIVDPNYIGQKFIIRVVNKGRAFARFLDAMDEIKGTTTNYAINRIYRSWIIDNEILQSKAIDGLMWGVNEARATRYINFDSIAHLMSENNTYGINAILEAFFENKNVLNALNNYFGHKFSSDTECTPSGFERVNSGATNIAYSDLKIHTHKPINVQIKDLGKCFDQNKKELVIYDQFKSFFGKSDNFENITIHLINGVDLTSVYDMKSHPNLTQNNVGIITIGIWDNTEGISKFGELFSALRLAYDAGYTGEEAFEKALDYLSKTPQSYREDEKNMLKQLQNIWADNPAELVVNIIENFRVHFQNNNAEIGGVNSGIEANLIQNYKENKINLDSIRSLDINMNKQAKDPTTSLELIQRQLEEKPLFRDFWNECTGVSKVIDRRYKNGPRGFIIDMTSDTFLPREHRTMFLIKNSNRWNIRGYSDKFLTERQFDDFVNLCFRKTSTQRDFGDNSAFPNHVWEQIRKQVQDKIVLQPNLFRPSLYALNERFTSKNQKFDVKKLGSFENFLDSINKKLKSGPKWDRSQLRILKEISDDQEIPNLAFILPPKGNLLLELLEPQLYSKLKRNLGNLSSRLAFQRYWFECTEQIEVLTPKNRGTPRGLIVDLTTDTFLPKEHKKVYMVKNSDRWNALGYRDHLLSSGNFDDFVTTLFNKKRIKDFRHREYPQYVWEKVQAKWGIKDRSGFELKLQKYRPNIYSLKGNLSNETIEYVMIGVYTEYISSLTNDQRKSLKSSGFRYLTQFLDHDRNIPRVLRPSKLPIRQIEKIFSK